MKNIPLLSRAPRFSHMLLAVLASVVFGGCSPYQKAAPQPEPTVPLTGMVTYRERMALPPDAELTVTLHRKTSDGRMLVAEERVHGRPQCPSALQHRLPRRGFLQHEL